MITLNGLLSVLKHVVVIAIFISIVLTPAYLATTNGRSKFDTMRVRMGSWIFGWSVIGWIFALFISAKK